MANLEWSLEKIDIVLRVDFYVQQSTNLCKKYRKNSKFPYGNVQCLQLENQNCWQAKF